MGLNILYDFLVSSFKQNDNYSSSTLQLSTHSCPADGQCDLLITNHFERPAVVYIGRASFPRLKASQTEFNFGEVPYLRVLTAEVVLMNSGFVDLGYTTDLERVTKPWTIDVPKKNGIIKANDKLKLEIRFMAGKQSSVSFWILLANRWWLNILFLL